MTDAQKTHYRKAFNSPYLSAADIVEPIVLTIDRVVLEAHKAGKKDDMCNTAYFVEKEIRPGEKLKPMILNVTNSETMRDMCGSPFINEWGGTVTLTVDPNARFLDNIGGIRIKPGSAFVSAAQAYEIDNLIAEVNADKSGFLRWAGCSEISKMPADKFAEAMRMLKAKKS